MKEPQFTNSFNKLSLQTSRSEIDEGREVGIEFKDKVDKQKCCFTSQLVHMKSV